MIEAAPVVCVHRDTRVPHHHGEVDHYMGSVVVGVIKDLPVPVLIGCNCPAFHLLWREAQKRPQRLKMMI